jgi:hypothetical protein
VEFIEKLNPSFVIERFAGEVPLRFIAGGVKGGDFVTIRFWCSLRKNLKKRIPGRGNILPLPVFEQPLSMPYQYFSRKNIGSMDTVKRQLLDLPL